MASGRLLLLRIFNWSLRINYTFKKSERDSTAEKRELFRVDYLVMTEKNLFSPRCAAAHTYQKLFFRTQKFQSVFA